MHDSWLEAGSIRPASSPSWMAPAPQTADRVSWGGRGRRGDSKRPSAPPARASTPPASGFPRSVIPPAPLAPTAIIDIDELVAPIAAELRAAIASSAASLAEARRDALFETERGLVELAVAIAERVVGRELRTDPTLIAQWAHEGITALNGEDEVTVVCSPDVAARLEGQVGTAALVLEVDPTAAPGSCRVRGRWGSVDESLRSRLDATVAALEASAAPGKTEDET